MASKYNLDRCNAPDRLQRISPLAKKVGDETVSEETGTLQELTPRIFEVMHRVANYKGPLSVNGKTNVSQVVEWFISLSAKKT